MLDHTAPRAHHTRQGFETLSIGGRSATVIGGFFVPSRQLNTGRGGACHTIPVRGKSVRVVPMDDFEHPGCFWQSTSKNHRRFK